MCPSLTPWAFSVDGPCLQRLRIGDRFIRPYRARHNLVKSRGLRQMPVLCMSRRITCESHRSSASGLFDDQKIRDLKR